MKDGTGRDGTGRDGEKRRDDTTHLKCACSVIDTSLDWRMSGTLAERPIGMPWSVYRRRRSRMFQRSGRTRLKKAPHDWFTSSAASPSSSSGKCSP